MLRQTFVHVPRIGRATELNLWRSGIGCWEDFIARYSEVPLPQNRKSDVRLHIEKSIIRLEQQDHRYFAQALPRQEMWRAYPDFPGKVAYLDIETTGLFPLADEITVIGIYDGKNVATFINGINLDDVCQELKKYSVLITFNGLRFDIPFIRSFMADVQIDHLHIDLLYPLRKLGYRGGLKSIERQLGIERESDVAHLTGFDAVRLWREYRRGSETALQTLVKYNSSDIVNLEYLMKFVYEELKKRTLVSRDE